MKKMKKISGVLVLAMGLALLGGCGKENNDKKLDKMIDKYSSYCTLNQYKGVTYEATKTTVTDEMIQSQVDSLLSTYSTTNYVTSGTAKDGDTVNIDFVGSVDGEEFEGGNSGGAGYDLTLGSGTFIAGFEEQIVGHKVGDQFDVTATFPDDYSLNPDLAGKEAVFAVTLNSIKETVYPEYTDEFVASYTDASSIAEYEQSLRDRMEENYLANDDNTNKSNVMQTVVDNATISEYPTKEMEELIDETVKNVESQASNYGYDLATYVTVYYGFSSEDEFRNYVSQITEDFIKEKCVVCAIAKAENIRVTDDEIKEYKKKMMDSYNMTDEDAFAEIYSEEDVLYYTLADKVAAFVVENAVPGEATGTDAE